MACFFPKAVHEKAMSDSDGSASPPLPPVDDFPLVDSLGAVDMPLVDSTGAVDPPAEEADAPVGPGAGEIEFGSESSSDTSSSSSSSGSDSEGDAPAPPAATQDADAAAAALMDSEEEDEEATPAHTVHFRDLQYTKDPETKKVSEKKCALAFKLGRHSGPRCLSLSAHRPACCDCPTA